MRIKNKTKGIFIADNVIEAVRWREKVFGLIFCKKPVAMIFKTRFGIHTFFMRYPIDVVLLDKNRRVVKMRKNMKTNRIFVWNPIYSLVVEMPERSIEKSKTEIGDFWEFNE